MRYSGYLIKLNKLTKATRGPARVIIYKAARGLARVIIYKATRGKARVIIY